MFQSFEYIRYVGGLSKKYIYKLTDTDFAAEILAAHGLAVGVGEAAILVEIYKKRNIEIHPNIIRYFRLKISNLNLTLQQIVESNYRYYPEISKEFYDKYLRYLCRSIIT